MTGKKIIINVKGAGYVKNEAHVQVYVDERGYFYYKHKKTGRRVYYK